MARIRVSNHTLDLMLTAYLPLAQTAVANDPAWSIYEGLVRRGILYG